MPDYYPVPRSWPGGRWSLPSVDNIAKHKSVLAVLSTTLCHMWYHPILLLVIHGHGCGIGFWLRTRFMIRGGVSESGWDHDRSQCQNSKCCRHQHNEMTRFVDQIEALAKAQLLRWFPGPETVSRAFKQ